MGGRGEGGGWTVGDGEGEVSLLAGARGVTMGAFSSV